MYEIDWSQEARIDFRNLPVFLRRQVTAAVAQLVHQAEFETRNRKRLSNKIEGLEEAEWNLRIGDLRLLYRIREGRKDMKIRPFKGSRAMRRELERISERMDREGGIPHAVIVQEMLDDMARELKRLVAAYDGSPRKAKELLEAFLISEAEGVKGVAELRRTLAGKLNSGKVGKRKAA